MKKYKVIIGGRGAELHIHPINEVQKQKLVELDIENEKIPVDWDKLNEILGVDNWDYAEETYIGAYPQPHLFHISVFDEQDNLVWESDEDSYLEEGEDENDYTMVEKENVLLIEHSMKGTFAEYVLETENEFNWELLTPKIVEVNEAVSVITSLNYEGKELELEEYGDTWSKNVNFYIF